MTITHRALLATAALLAALALPSAAQDRANIDPTQIIGNRELPKVLYIVPWKKPLPGALAGRPTASVMDEALDPIDRDVFRRQLRYDAQLREASTDSATPAAAPSPATPKRP
jgi:hypothetical protein